MKKKYIILMLSVLVVFIVLIPYTKVEIQTILHSDEFENVKNEIPMLEDFSYYKVMKYSKKNAEILCVGKNHKASFLLQYEKAEGEWCMKEWRCIHSESGTADEFIWPFYR